MTDDLWRKFKRGLEEMEDSDEEPASPRTANPKKKVFSPTGNQVPKARQSNPRVSSSPKNLVGVPGLALVVSKPNANANAKANSNQSPNKDPVTSTISTPTADSTSTLEEEKHPQLRQRLEALRYLLDYPNIGPITTCFTENFKAAENAIERGYQKLAEGYLYLLEVDLMPALKRRHRERLA